MAKQSERDDDEPKGGRPGPADHGREGGMATARRKWVDAV
ncbi:hypothetical protein MYCO108962_23610 [Mycobacterium colombiense]